MRNRTLDKGERNIFRWRRFGEGELAELSTKARKGLGRGYEVEERNRTLDKGERNIFTYKYWPFYVGGGSLSMTAF